MRHLKDLSDWDNIAFFDPLNFGWFVQPIKLTGTVDGYGDITAGGNVVIVRPVLGPGIRVFSTELGASRAAPLWWSSPPTPENDQTSVRPHELAGERLREGQGRIRDPELTDNNLTTPLPYHTPFPSGLRPEHRAWLLEKLRWPVWRPSARTARPASPSCGSTSTHRDVVLVNTLAGRLKHRHLQRDPRVSLCFEDESHYLTIEGRAELAAIPEWPASGPWRIGMARATGRSR